MPSISWPFALALSRGAGTQWRGGRVTPSVTLSDTMVASVLDMQFLELRCSFDDARIIHDTDLDKPVMNLAINIKIPLDRLLAAMKSFFDPEQFSGTKAAAGSAAAAKPSGPPPKQPATAPVPEPVTAVGGSGWGRKKKLQSQRRVSFQLSSEDLTEAEDPEEPITFDRPLEELRPQQYRDYRSTVQWRAADSSCRITDLERLKSFEPKAINVTKYGRPRSECPLREPTFTVPNVYKPPPPEPEKEHSEPNRRAKLLGRQQDNCPHQ